ncbi:MAG: hypothetical protein D6795_01825 [Deltaproteobacteria bacterium]|nr:MAG: hypothetical protein D6795_01825 [Deltaproteobacteria bacterium]
MVHVPELDQGRYIYQSLIRDCKIKTQGAWRWTVLGHQPGRFSSLRCCPASSMTSSTPQWSK